MYWSPTESLHEIICSWRCENDYWSIVYEEVYNDTANKLVDLDLPPTRNLFSKPGNLVINLLIREIGDMCSLIDRTSE